MTSAASLVLDLVEVVGRAPIGGRVTVPIRDASDAEVAAAWCRRTGNSVVLREPEALVIRRGQPSDPVEELPPDRRPGWRLWLYTNFDCNLACDYCCVRSSPRTARRGLGLGMIQRIVAEAVPAGVRELFVTGGEPFLLPDIGDILRVCAAALPTTVLTNAMLFSGRRLQALRGLPRQGLALQVSLDSGDSALHDRHRGAGSFDRAVEGIRLARRLGFRVRVAATVGSDGVDAEPALHAFLDTLAIPDEDRTIRRVARRGNAGDGVVVDPRSLLPEMTIAVGGVYWHPVGADDEDMLVTRDVFPLSEAIELVARRFRDERLRQSDAAAVFPCA